MDTINDTRRTDAVRRILDQLDTAGIEDVNVELKWYAASDSQAQQIVGLFPDRPWLAERGLHEWISSHAEGVGFVVHLEQEIPEPPKPVRGQHVIDSARAEAGR